MAQKKPVNTTLSTDVVEALMRIRVDTGCNMSEAVEIAVRAMPKPGEIEARNRMIEQSARFFSDALELIMELERQVNAIDLLGIDVAAEIVADMRDTVSTLLEAPIAVFRRTVEEYRSRALGIDVDAMNEKAAEQAKEARARRDALEAAFRDGTLPIDFRKTPQQFQAHALLEMYRAGKVKDDEFRRITGHLARDARGAAWQPDPPRE